MKARDLYISRRDFLRGLSLTTATVATGTSVRRLADALDQRGGRKLGIALLGLGRYSTNQLAPALREAKLCFLAGVVTGHPEKADKLAADYNFESEEYL